MGKMKPESNLDECRPKDSLLNIGFIISQSLKLENGNCESMIKIRIDVDYPFPSRLQSFISTALDIRVRKDYLKNSKILAKLINESPEKVSVYWFFTPHTIPDSELLRFLHLERHDVGLHVATQPFTEWKQLEKATGRNVKYYTVHGTARLVARLIWRRKIWESRATIPTDFPLRSFYDFPTLALDWLCYKYPFVLALKIARESVSKGEVLHIHPEWLFQRGTLNRRGPYYETLRTLLGVDKELEGLQIRNKGFVRIARYAEENEFLHYAPLSTGFFEKLAERQVDLFTFIERKWSSPPSISSSRWSKVEDNVALLKIIPYEDWLNSVGKKTRNMIRKAEKSCVKVEIADPSEKLAKGIWRIYNETPVRQNRAFSHYGLTLDNVKALISAHAKDGTYIGAYFNGELVGFAQLLYGDQIAVMTQILSLQQHWDKAVNNALVAKAVEVCAAKSVPWLMYGRMGNHPSLDSFKKSNGFSKFDLTRYFVPLSTNGRVAAKLGLHKELKDTLPQRLKGPLIPVFNWASRTKVLLKSKLR